MFGTEVCIECCQQSDYEHSVGGGNTYVRVVCKIRTRLVTSRGSGRSLPARNIYGLKVLCHLSNHDWVETAIGEASFAILNILSAEDPMGNRRIVHSDLELVLENVPKLLAHLIIGEYLLDRATLVNDLLGSEGTLCVAPAAVCPPLLYGLDLILELFLLGLQALCGSHVVVL